MLNLGAGDVLAMGLDLERTAAKFYAQAARQSKDENCRALLDDLSRIEVGHERRLLSWRDRLPAEERAPTMERIAEAKVALSALASGPFVRFKTDPGVHLSGSESTEDILEIAIALEENAIALLTALMDLMPPQLSREKVEDMRSEEQSHRSRLDEQLVVYRLRHPRR